MKTSGHYANLLLNVYFNSNAMPKNVALLYMTRVITSEMKILDLSFSSLYYEVSLPSPAKSQLTPLLDTGQ